MALASDSWAYTCKWWAVFLQYIPGYHISTYRHAFHSNLKCNSIIFPLTKFGHNFWNKKMWMWYYIYIRSDQSLILSDCLWPMNRSTAGLPVHHQLPEFTETHVHWVSDASQPSHPLSSPSPPAPNTSQHQNLSQWVNSSHEVAKVLEFQL